MPAPPDIDEPQQKDDFGFTPEADDFGFTPEPINPGVVKPLNADQPSIREAPGLGEAAPVRVVPPRQFDETAAQPGVLAVPAAAYGAAAEPFTHAFGTSLTQLTEKLPWVPPVKKFISEKVPGGKYVVGAFEGVQSLADSFASPLGVATLGMSAFPKVVQRGISLAFASDMAKNMPEEAKNLAQAYVSGDQAKIAQAWVGLLGNTLFATLAAKHGIKPGGPPGAPPSAGGAEKPPVIPATLPESVATQPLVPRQTPTPGAPNASQNAQAAAVHGNVQPLEKPPVIVPVEEGGPGVQPQTPGGIQGAAAPPGPSPAPLRAAQAVADHPVDQKWDKGGTVEAMKFGGAMDPSRPEDLDALIAMRDKAKAEYDGIPDDTQANQTRKNTAYQKFHWLDEAIEAATGPGTDVSRNILGADHKAPFPRKVKTAMTGTLTTDERGRLAELRKLPSDKLTPDQQDELLRLVNKEEEVTPVETKKEEAKGVLKPAGPRIFTDEAAAAAKARLKDKLFSPKFGLKPELPAGLDPQSWKDLVTVAGNIVEGGAIKFADFVQEAVNQLGEGIRPFVKQLYADVSQHPEAGSLKPQMTPPEEFGQEPGKVPVPPSPVGPVTFDPAQVPTVETPTEDIKLSADVPNFKAGADPETGIVPGQELKGPYRRLGSAPIIVWRRLNGDLEVITGRHRLELAKRSGEKTVPTQIVDEAKGYTKEMALTEDAEGNIRDNQGTVEDYAHYFKQRIDLTEEDARQRGLLRNAAGRSGFDIGRKASEDLQSLWRAGKIGDAQTLAIARAAPGNASAQQIGIKFAMEGKPADFVSNVVKAAMSESGGQEKNLDLFGNDDSAMQSMAAQASEAAKVQKDLKEQLSAISGAAKKPDVARKLGVDISDPAAVQAKVAELKSEIARWENWPMHPDLVERTRGGREPLVKPEPPKPAGPAPALKPGENQGDLVSSTQKEDLSLAGEKATDAERDAAEKAQDDKDKAEAKAKQDKEQQGFQGMGGAVASEFEQSGQTATAIKNATVDRERAVRGLPPAMEPLRRAFGQVWDAAMALIDQRPEAQDELIDELRDKPRALTDTEDALLLHRQVALQNEYGKATRDLAQAFEDGNDAMVQQNKLRVAEMSDKLQDLYDIGKRAGTETGRGLNARKMMAAEDFTLAKMELDKRAANDGKPLTDAQREEITRLNARIEATQKAYDDYVQKSQERISQMEAQHAIDMLKREAAPIDPVVKRIVDRIGNILHTQRDAARARIMARGGRLMAGLDPTELADYAVIGASHLFDGALDFAKWSGKFLADMGPLGKSLEPHLNEIFKAANDHFDATIDQVGGKQAPKVRKIAKTDSPKEKIEKTKDAIKAKAGAAEDADLGRLVNKLARSLIEDGVTDFHGLIDEVHGFLKTIDPEITRREAMDAISGYGKYKLLSKDAISVQLRDLKGQMQQTAKLLDMFEGKAPEKTGVERRTPSDEERRRLQQVNEAKKRFGINTTDPAKQLKSALDSIKTRLRNQIADYEAQLASKTKTVHERAPVPEDAETTALKERRDALKKDFDEMFGKPELTDQQRVERALQSLERQSAEIERQIKQGDIFPEKRPSKTPSTPELEAAKAKREALKLEREYLRESIQPTERMSPEQIALKALKSRLANRTAELQDKLAKGDFTTKPRRPITLDAEAQRLKAANERAKDDFRKGLVKDRLKNRTTYEKVGDALVKWRRAFLLSSPVTLAKLTSAAVQRMTITPIEEAIGGAFSKAFPEIAKRAQREGGVSVTAESKALTEGFTKGMKDAWQVLKTGKSELDLLYGKDLGYPDELINFMGNLHGALKTVTKRNEFARSLQKRAEAAMKAGIDTTDPLVQTRLAVDAYKDANRSIFMQDNRVVAGYKRLLSGIEQVDKTTGKVPLGGKILGTAARVLLPIVKIPTNIVAETFEYATGTVTGSARLARALSKGVENLKPEEADLIMRNLKKGSLGAAVMLLGFFNPNVVGGYYQQGEKRKKTDVKPGTVRAFGHDIPSYLLHNPLLETLQLGATIRRVADSKLRKRDTENQGIGAGVMAGALGLSEEVPFVREMAEVTKAFNPHERGAFFGELGRSALVPQAVQWVAQHTDKDAQGNLIARKPATAMERVKVGIPGLRQQVKKNPVQPRP